MTSSGSRSTIHRVFDKHLHVGAGRRHRAWFDCVGFTSLVLPKPTGVLAQLPSSHFNSLCNDEAGEEADAELPDEPVYLLILTAELFRPAGSNSR